MKDRYFLVVLCAVVCTVWSEAEWQGCNFIDLNECLNHFPVSPDDGKSLLFTSKEELDRSCRNVNRGLQCLDRYVRRCMTKEDSYRIHSKLNRNQQYYKKLCTPGPYQEEFLLHAPCLSQLSDDYEHFFHQYKQKIFEFLAKLEDPHSMLANEMQAEPDIAMRTVCSLFRNFVDGLQRITMEKCGEKTAKFIENALNQLYEDPTLKEMCNSYLHGSANRNFQRALLLPISLAMLSLYALRYT